MKESPLLKLEKICYHYDDHQEALKDVSFELGRGERIAVIGNNGSGKTSFFLVCNAILTPESGELYYDGAQIRSGDKKALQRLRKAVGIVFQDADSQIIASTVAEEVSFGPFNLGLNRAEVATRVEDALAAMDLTEMAKRPPQYLSGGEKKRVCIADILAMQAEIILFDEPTAYLDSWNSELLEQTLRDLAAKGISLLISTHNMDFALRFAERILLFSEGEILADDTPEAIFSNEALLRKAKLQKPLLYQIAEALGLAKMPRTIDELISPPRNG